MCLKVTVTETFSTRGIPIVEVVAHTLLNTAHTVGSDWLQSWLMPQPPHRLRNDLKCVEWDVKPCPTQPNHTHRRIAVNFRLVILIQLRTNYHMVYSFVVDIDRLYNWKNAENICCHIGSSQWHLVRSLVIHRPRYQFCSFACLRIT